MAFSVTNDFTNGTTADATEVNQNFADIENAINFNISPIGSITAWLKTFSEVISGTADSDTTDKLVDSSATFETDGVKEGMIIHNETDNTFGIVDSVDSETEISIRADTQSGSSETDIFPDGNEEYVIYATPELGDWVECNGQTIDDSDSPYNGATVPDLNSEVESGLKGRFLRGHTKSGEKEDDEFRSHKHDVKLTDLAYAGHDKIHDVDRSGDSDVKESETTNTGGDETRPYNYSVVFIIRIK